MLAIAIVDIAQVLLGESCLQRFRNFANAFVDDPLALCQLGVQVFDLNYNVLDRLL